MDNITALSTLRDNPAPIPLIRDIPEGIAYPVEALPPLLRDAAIGIQDKTQAPMAVCAQSVLAAATLAVQGHKDVKLPTGGIKPLSNFFLTLAASGERKSATDTEATASIKSKEAELYKQYLEKKEKYLFDKRLYDTIAKKAENKAQDLSQARDNLNVLGKPPQRPLEPILLCPEPTFEGFCVLLGIGQPSVGIFSAEGGQFIGGHGMNQENRLKTATGLSGLWDGEAIKRVRVGEGSTSLYGKRLAVHLMAQPDIALGFLSDTITNAQGLLSRFLMCSPSSTAGTRLYRQASLKSCQDVTGYQTHMSKILDMPYKLHDGTDNELWPEAMILKEDAKASWITYHDENETKMAKDGEYATIRNLANKLPEHAVRLAAVMSAFDDLSNVYITKEYMDRGITLARYYASEAVRLSGAGFTNPDMKLAHRLLCWLTEKRLETITLPDIYQRGFTEIRDAEVARRIVSILEKHHWLVRIESGLTVDGRHRKDAWRINVE